MEIKTDIRNCKALQFFLEDLGFKTWWDGNLILNVLPSENDELLAMIAKEYRSTGWVPYHMALSPSFDGEVWTEEKVEFIGKAVQTIEFRNMLGKFNIILFESDTNNFVWKSYTDNLPPAERRKITARPVTKLTKDGKTMNLISYVRTYALKED